MGTEKNLNKALSDIYEDLEKLQSAREQVENLTENSENIIKSTSILLKELREFSNKFEKENINNISQLSQNLEEFENKINEIYEKYNSSTTNYTETFKNKIMETLEEFEQITKDLKINTEHGIENVSSKANKLIEKLTNYDIPNNLESINNKLKIQDKQNNLIKILLFVVLGLLGVSGISVMFLIIKLL